MALGNGNRKQGFGSAWWGVSLIVVGVVALGVQFSPVFADRSEPAPSHKTVSWCDDDPEPFDAYDEYFPDVVRLRGPARGLVLRVKNDVPREIHSAVRSGLRDVHSGIRDARSDVRSGLRDAQNGLHEARQAIREARHDLRSALHEEVHHAIRHTIRTAVRTIPRTLRGIFRDGTRSLRPDRQEREVRVIRHIVVVSTSPAGELSAGTDSL